MKRIKGGTHIVRGQMNTNTAEKIQLVDGKFTTGYKVTKFIVYENFPTTGKTIVSTLKTQSNLTLGYFNFGDDSQIAWATNNAPINTRWGEFALIDPTNMLIEDLYVEAYADGEAITINYYIELEKYEFPAWDGAGQMVRNNLQGGPE